MPVGKKIMFSALLLGAGAFGYWLEVMRGMEENVYYLIALIVLLMLSIWTMSPVQKKSEDDK